MRFKTSNYLTMIKHCLRRYCDVMVVISVYIDGYFPLGEKLCVVWATMDVLLCTASIWHMATMSVDRYCSLRFPLRYRHTRTPVFVVAKIAFVWIVSIGICSPLAIAGFISPLNVYRGGRCAPAVPEFVIYGSIFAFYVPLVLMLVAYALTVRTLTRHAVWRRRKRARSLHVGNPDTQPDGQQAPSLTDSSSAAPNMGLNQSVNGRSLPDGECSTEPETRASSAIALSGLALHRAGANDGEDPNTEDESKALRDGTSPMPERSGTANGDCIASHISLSAGRQTPKDSDDRDTEGEMRRKRDDGPSHNHTDGAAHSRTSRTVSITTHRDKNGDDDVTLPSNVRRNQAGAPGHVTTGGHRRVGRQESISTQTRRLKRKATRVLGVIFVVFVLLWTPFFVLNLLSAACARCVRSVGAGVWTVAVWLGWMSSSANPIIYTCFSPAFRSAFKHLLTCCCRRRRRMSAAKLRQQQLNSLLRDHRIRYDSQSIDKR